MFSRAVTFASKPSETENDNDRTKEDLNFKGNPKNGQDLEEKKSTGNTIIGLEVKEEDESEEEEANTDDDSMDLKIPILTSVKYTKLGFGVRIFNMILLIIFQSLTVCWIWIAFNYIQLAPTFVPYLINWAFFLTLSVELIYQVILTILPIILLVQRGSFRFLRKSNILFDIFIGSYISQLIVFLVFAFVTENQVLERMEAVMIVNFENYNRKFGLSSYWKETHKKYKCCGWGRGYADFYPIPSSCCENHPCTPQNMYPTNCYTYEAQLNTQIFQCAKILLGIAIPCAILLYLGIRYYRAFWIVENPDADKKPSDSLDTLYPSVEGLPDPPDFPVEPKTPPGLDELEKLFRDFDSSYTTYMTARKNDWTDSALRMFGH